MPQCHPARDCILQYSQPEVRIVPGGLLVNDACNFEAFDGNVARENFAVSEVNLCLRRETAG
jgi:hypothetical protein